MFTNHRFLRLFFGICFLAVHTQAISAEQTAASTDRGDQLVARYFEIQTERLSRDVLSSDTSLDDWKSRRPELQRQLREMLGLDPLPPSSALQAEVVASTDHADYRVERLHFQAMPGLYVAANFYLPLQVDAPLPTILYTCGHARAVQDGVSFGNKTGYHHHGIWFARNGYACLMIDTIQLGEFLGDHHGTYSQKQWWWNNCGYTPAGVEAWTSVRALDYLETRPEVDAERFGVTGRSGGGAYTWWITAIDDRVKVAVPVAGITTLHNHIVDGCVEGHCDCMFMVNTYQWDYPMVAALAAPRPLLISNSDKDSIFPLEGVVETHRQVRQVYRLYDADKNLGLQITEGPHKDTQELRVHAFRWFNRFLKKDDSLIRIPAEKELEPSELKVFDQLPEDQRVTTIQETFVPKVEAEKLPENEEELKAQSTQWMSDLSTKTFAGWPSESATEPLDPVMSARRSNRSVECDEYQFTSQHPYRLSFYVVRPKDASDRAKTLEFIVLQDEAWHEFGTELELLLNAPESETDGAAATPALDKLVKQHPDATVVLFAPRGAGPTRWSQASKKGDQLLRRFMLLGQTADGMRIWDIRRCLQAVSAVESLAGLPTTAAADGNAAAWMLFASLYEPSVSTLRLSNLATRNREAISLLNVSRFVEIPHVLLMASRRVDRVELVNAPQTADEWGRILDQSALFSNVHLN